MEKAIKLKKKEKELLEYILTAVDFLENSPTKNMLKAKIMSRAIVVLISHRK